MRNYFLLPDTLKEKHFKKLYLKREVEKRNVINSNEVEDCVAKNGFEIISLENTLFSKQVEIFRRCNVLVSIHGAGLTNMIFMPSCSIILELCKPGEKMDKCYFNMSRVLGHRYYYLYGVPEDFKSDYSSSNLYIDTEKLNALLKEFN